MSRERPLMSDAERLAAGRLRDAAVIWLLSPSAEVRGRAAARIGLLCRELAMVQDDQVLALRMTCERGIGMIPDGLDHHARELRMRWSLADLLAAKAGLLE